MKIKNEKGEIFTVLAIVAMTILGLVFVPNDLSKAAGLQNKQNKIVQKETSTLELLKDSDGKPIRGEDGSYIVRRSVKMSDTDQQQEVTLWERIRALPFVLLLLVIAGAFCTPIAGVLAVVNKRLTSGVKQMIIGIENAKKAMHPDNVTTLNTELSKKMDASIKTTVKKIKADKTFPV